MLICNVLPGDKITNLGVLESHAATMYLFSLLSLVHDILGSLIHGNEEIDGGHSSYLIRRYH